MAARWSTATTRLESSTGSSSRELTTRPSVPAAAISVHARGNQKAIDNLEVVVEDGALVIRPKKKMNFGWGKSGKVALTVTVPSLRGAELAGSGDIRIDRVAGDSFDGGIAGSGNLTVGSVEVNRLKMSISGSGNAKASGGRAKSVEYSIAGSGGIDAKGVAAETASVSIAGSGNVDGQATSTASVNIMGSGNVAPDRRGQVHGVQGGVRQRPLFLVTS